MSEFQTVADLPDPVENPAIWFKAYAALPAADGGTGLAETLAVPGGSLWWMVDYWAYFGGMRGVTLPALLKKKVLLSPFRIRARNQLKERVKVGRDFFRARTSKFLLPESQPQFLATAFTSIWGNFHFEDQKLEGDIHIGPVLEKARIANTNYWVIERDSLPNILSGHPQRPSQYVAAHLLRHKELMRGYDRQFVKQCKKKLRKIALPPVSPLIDRWMQVILEDLYSVRLGEAYRLYVGARNLLKMCRPSCLLLTDESDMFGRVFLTTAKAQGIRTVALQHGVLYEQHYGYANHPAALEGTGGLPLPDRTCVYGTAFADYLTGYGCYNPDSIRVTGIPRHDYLGTTDVLPGRARKDLGIDEGALVVTFATQPFARDIRIRMLEILIEALVGQSYTLVVKLHPGDDMLAVYKSLLAETSITWVVTREYDLIKLLADTDVMVTGHSTTVLEAARLGVDSITLDIDGIDDVLHYRDTGGVLVACDGQELRSLIPLSSSNQQKLVAGRRVLLQKFLKDTNHATEAVFEELSTE